MSRWQEEYQRKLVSPQEAVQYIKSGHNIVLPLGAGEPPVLLEAMVSRKNEVENVTLHQMLPLRKLSYLSPEMEKHFRHNSWFIGGASRPLVQGGLADVTPNYFHDSPRLMTEYLDIDILMATVSPMDKHGYFSFGVSVDYTTTAARNAKMVILEVNPNMPRTMGDSFIHISEVSLLVESNEPIFELRSPAASEMEMTIGQHIAELVDDGSTIQLGIGGIPNATAQFLLEKRDLGIHTEMLTESMMDLVEQGAVTGRMKSLHRGKVVACFALGTRRLYDFIDDNPLIEMHPVSYTNDPYIIGQQHKAVSINSALEVDLLGQVAAETIGHLQFSGTGGQSDFAKGVLRSPGGKGFIAITSTTKNGEVSKIVPTLQPGAVVSTSKNEVDYVVTEYGVAKLRGKSLRQRAEELIAVAHPDFRSSLREEAKRLHIL